MSKYIEIFNQTYEKRLLTSSTGTVGQISFSISLPPIRTLSLASGELPVIPQTCLGR